MSAIDVIGQEKALSIPLYIRVALCPVGSINASTFRKYASLVTQLCETVPLNQLTRFPNDNKKSPFQQMNWDRGGIMRFLFVDSTNIPTLFTEVHQYRKVHAVIGIMSCLSEMNIAHGYQKYVQLKRQFGHQASTQIGKCFAVEEQQQQQQPVQQQLESSNSGNATNNNSSNNNYSEPKDLHRLPSQDLEHLKFYITSLFQDLAGELMRTFEAYASHPKHLLSLALSLEEQQFQQQQQQQQLLQQQQSSSSSSLAWQQKKSSSSSLSSSSSSSSSSSGYSSYYGWSDAVIKKRNEVKSLKIVGDYALLAGDYNDAIISYQQAVDLAKTLASDDPITYASCLESFASVLYCKYSMVVTSLSGPMIEDIAQKCEEAIQWYSRSTAKELHVESLLRYAQFHANMVVNKNNSNINNSNANTGNDSNSTNGSSGSNSGAQKMRALENITKAVECSTGLTTQERILVCGLAARMCHTLGFKRKFAFFLRETAMLHGQLHNQSVSMRLGSLCLDSFHVPIRLSDSEWVHCKPSSSSSSSVSSSSLSRNGIMAPSRGWQRLQLKLLRDVISFAASMSPADFLTEAQLTLYLLCAYYDVLKWAEQAELFERFCELSRKIHQNSASISLLPLPLLNSVEPLKMPAHLEPIAHKESDEGKSSIFIFSPFDRDDSTVMKINWVQNELARVNITLKNPFLIDLILKRISLTIKLEHGDCEVYETSAVLKPGTEQTVEINVRPLGHGRLEIQAVEIDFEKCNLKHPLTIPVPALRQNDKDIEITVLEKIPLLNVHVPSSVISLFDGESLSTTLSFQNISSNAIHSIRTSLENKSRSKLRIDDSVFLQSMPLNPNGQTINADLEIEGKYSGDGNHVVDLKVKYFGVSKAWYREITIPIHLNLSRGLVLLSCVSVNELYGREIVAEIENQSEYSFVLLSNNEEEVKEKLSHERSIVERHNNVDWKQFVQGIPMAPGSKKMIVVGSHILHDKPMTDTNQTSQTSAPFHIPYSANIDEYKEEIASRLRWKSAMNTYGVVGSVLPEVAPQTGYVNPYVAAAAAAKKREEELARLSKRVDLKLSIEIGNEEDGNVLQLDNFDVDVIRTTPPMFHAQLGTPQNLRWTLHCEPKHEKAFRVSIQIYQDAPNGSKIQVSSEQLAFAGQLTMSNVNYDEAMSSTEQSVDFQHQVKLFFLETGYFNISVECTHQDRTEELLAKPLQIIAHINE